MFDNLVKCLRNCATNTAPCNTCNLIEDDSCSDTLMKQAADAIEELSRQREYWELEAAAQETDKNYLIDENRKLVEAWQNALNLRVKWKSVEKWLPDARKEVYVTDGEYIARANLLDEVFPGDQPCWSYSGLGEITHWCERIPLPEPPKEDL